MEAIRKSLPNYQEGAKRGDRECQYWLGYCYFHGQGIEVNWRKAVSYMKKAAAQGSGKAAYQLGFCYDEGRGIKKNKKRSQFWYQQAIPLLQQEVAYDNNNNNDNENDDDSNNATIDYESMGMLGHAYHSGNGVPKDIQRGIEFYKQAGEHGNNTVALNLLAYCYQNGLGVEQDISKAFSLFQRSAAQGNYSAQDELGKWYLDGAPSSRVEGTEDDDDDDDDVIVPVVKRNVRQAIRCFEMAAQNGSFFAKCSLASCYENGIGVEKDVKKAIQLYTQAADGGYVSALNDLGYLYLYQLGEEDDMKKAVKLFHEAARRGSTSGAAEENLAYCYEHGYGVKKNPRLAVKWYHKSMQVGNDDDGRTFLIRLIEKLKTIAHQQEKNVLKALAYCYRNGVGVQQSHEMANALLGHHPASSYSCYAKTNNNNNNNKKGTSTSIPETTLRKCVCCEDRLSTTMLVHGSTGHACFCLPCALSCYSRDDYYHYNDDNECSGSSCCPICRASIDKVILLLPTSNCDDVDDRYCCSTTAKNKNNNGLKRSSSCVSCGKKYSNSTIIHGETGHSCCCYECACEAKKAGLGCPTCQEFIDDVVRHYHCA